MLNLVLRTIRYSPSTMDPSTDGQALVFHATGPDDVDNKAVLAHLVADLITSVSDAFRVVLRRLESAIPFLLQRLWSAEPQITKRWLGEGDTCFSSITHTKRHSVLTDRGRGLGCTLAGKRLVPFRFRSQL